MAEWTVAWLCCFLSFLLLGAGRLSGLLFVALVDLYGVSRSEAALPFVLCYTVRNVAGPLIGYLGRRLGLRRVCLSGCVLSAVGIGSCFLARDVVSVAFLWGGVFGLGLGLSTVLIPEILRQHFSHDIAKANGIAFGGECLAGFVLPVLFKVTLNSFGTQGTFLILSGLVLNSVPAAMLLKKPEQQTHKAVCLCDHSIHQGGVGHQVDFEESTFYGVVNGSTSTSKNLAQGAENDQKYLTKSASDRNLKEEKTKDENLESSVSESEVLISEKSKQLDFKDWNLDLDEQIAKSSSLGLPKVGRSVAESSVGFSYIPQKSWLGHPKSSHCSNVNENECFLTGHSENHMKCSEEFSGKSERACSEHPSPKSREHGRSPVVERDPASGVSNPTVVSFKVFLDVTFLLILVIQSAFIYIVTTVLTVVVDFSKDVGATEHEQIYLVMSMSIADMIGRFGLGFVTDSGYMTNTAFTFSSFATMGLTLMISVWLKAFLPLMIVMFLFGLLLGGLLIVFPGTVSEYVEEDHIAMALASRMSLYGPLSLTQSSLIGFFRGRMGTYDGVFYTVAMACFVCCLLTLLTPYAAKRRNANRL